MRTLTKEMQAQLTPEKAIKLLKDGNERFINNLKINRNLLQQVNETSEGQHPFAFILSCIDSRTSAELIFDQGLGDIFSCRIAGNVLNEDILGSMEFACKVAGSKVVVVLGHTKCGAIKGACDHVELGNLTTLLEKVKPAIDFEEETRENRNASNPAFVENVSRLNVQLTLKQILKKSPVIAELIENGEIALIGAMYDVETGAVAFYEDEIIHAENLESAQVNS
ncbi:Carbonic anhydrase [Fulvivirga imtechensis AK7]|uniref:Carbonic anhydrase n=1 Tax=Fulvivirga imtechensis AK7 TaxID=1237149 RepID=L8JRR1_9BACT|nr:carbonic anhydrase family protein [Fulvivirga imtechensis]ELR70052.1 Carbonic anhydrase [Fulvivirga imtechensis AK7]